MHPAVIINEYEVRGAVLYGTFGIYPTAIVQFFQRRSWRVTVTYNTNQFDSVAKRNKANIIWYWHSSGAHYVALRWTGYRFVAFNTFNDSTGIDDLGLSLSGFIRNRGYSGSILISIA